MSSNRVAAPMHIPRAAASDAVRGTLPERRGQSLIEYAAVIAVFVAAFLTGAIYLKQGLSGGLRNSSDSIGEQYHPKQTTSTFTLTVKSDTTTVSELIPDQPISPTETGDVMATRTTINDDLTTRSGWEQVQPLGNDLWK